MILRFDHGDDEALERPDPRHGSHRPDSPFPQSSLDPVA
jgi:hypothetical protein